MAISTSEYQVMMGNFANFVNNSVGTIFEQNNLGVNIAVLINTVFSAYVSCFVLMRNEVIMMYVIQLSGNEQVVVFAGDTSTVFDRLDVAVYLARASIGGAYVQILIELDSLFVTTL
jgi:hypothetical protein